MLFSIKATVDRIEGGKAILLIEEEPKIKLPSQEIVWPQQELPPNIGEGEAVIIAIMKQVDATLAKEEMARKMLDALLKKSNEGK